MFPQTSTRPETDRSFGHSNCDAASTRAFRVHRQFSRPSRPLSVDAEAPFDIDYLRVFRLCRLRESFGLDRRRDSRRMCPEIMKEQTLISVAKRRASWRKVRRME
jgi:hypothetical protein